MAFLNQGGGQGGYGGGLDPQQMQQLLAAALAQSGGGQGASLTGSPPSGMPGGPWQDSANNAPRQGGQGDTPPMPAFHYRSPQPSMAEAVMNGMSHTPMTGGGNSPYDGGIQGNTPRILDKIPNQPPIIPGDHDAIPIPTNPDMFGGAINPINNNSPFGFGMMGGMFGGY